MSNRQPRRRDSSRTSIGAVATKRFWRWFKEHLQEIEAGYDADRVVKEIDRHVRSLGPFTWEIGPGRDKEFSFVLSPGGNASLVNMCRRVVSRAPIFASWELHSSKPPKDWSYKFSFLLTDGNEIAVDATLWRYRLLRYTDSATLDIDICAPALTTLCKRDQTTAAEIVLDSVLGEAGRLEAIGRIEVFERLDGEGVGIPIQYLAAHVMELTGRAPF